MSSSPDTKNAALNDEIEALRSIYDAQTLSEIVDIQDGTTAVLSPPDIPITFSLTFDNGYPDTPPSIAGTYHIGQDVPPGAGAGALSILRAGIGEIYQPGLVCLFDLIEDTAPKLKEYLAQIEQSHIVNHPVYDDVGDHDALNSVDSATNSISALDSPPNWHLTSPLLVQKSTFVGRSLHVASLSSVTSSTRHLLQTDRRVAAATHNIRAWRIRIPAHDGKPETTIQDCDDDGETAAGGRLLHLMQLMDIWDCLVVVSRWYGGVKLGPERFKCINNVAKEAMMLGGFAKDESAEKVKGKKK